MLRATLKLLRPGGRTGFFTVVPVDGLSASGYKRSIRLGPRAVSTRRRSQQRILHAAGFTDIRSEDVTAAWRETTERLLLEQERLAEALIEAVGRQTFLDRQRKLRQSLRSVDEGLLQRRLFIAMRPRRDD